MEIKASPMCMQEYISLSSCYQTQTLNYYSHSDTPPYTTKSLDTKAFLNPFRYKVSRLLPAKLHTRRFAVTVSFRRKLLTLRQLSHGQNICFYFADASARTSSDAASTCGASILLYYRTKGIELMFKLKLQNENILKYLFLTLQLIIVT